MESGSGDAVRGGIRQRAQSAAPPIPRQSDSFASLMTAALERRVIDDGGCCAEGTLCFAFSI